jgi:hypothetical protein
VCEMCGVCLWVYTDRGFELSFKGKAYKTAAEVSRVCGCAVCVSVGVDRQALQLQGHGLEGKAYKTAADVSVCRQTG